MNNSQKTLLELIKRSLFGISDDHFCFEDVDWGEVYDEAVCQSVVNLILYEVPNNIYLFDNRWERIKEQHISYIIQYLYAEKQLIELLDSADVPFVILKGNAAAIYYNNPTRRTMGDIDFLVPQHLFEKTDDLLSRNGYIREAEPHNPRHIEYNKFNIPFELHHHFSHEDIDIEEYLISGLDQRVFATINTHSFPMLPKLSNGLVLLDHMKSHLKSGLGLRQVIDWMMFVNKELNDDYWNNEFAEVVRTKGLEQLAIVATRMCQLYLGLPDKFSWCKNAKEEVCHDLMEIVLVSGNFGRKMGDGGNVETVRTQIRKNGMLKWLQKAGEYNWKAYKKHHWLKPFCWIYQIIRYSRKGFESRRSYKLLSDDFDRSKRRSEILEKLGIKI